MSKTPYEVRLDVLKMAQDMLEEQRQATVKAVLSRGENDHISYEQVRRSVDEASYTTNDILSKANELYAFVNNSSTTSKKE